MEPFEPGKLYKNDEGETVCCVEISNAGARMKMSNGGWYSVDTFGECDFSPGKSITQVDKKDEPTIYNVAAQDNPAQWKLNYSIKEVYTPDELKPGFNKHEHNKVNNAGGAIKFDSGKPSLAIIPPRAYEKVGKAFDYGSHKYSSENYLEGGFTHRRLISAALRHINAHLRNEDIDPESGNCHLSHASASLMMLMELVACGKDEDDRYKP